MTAITRYLQHRRDTSANWTASATPPKAGQLCFTTDVFYTGTDQMKFKVGDGIQTWSQLDYMPISGGSQTLQQVLTAGSALTQNNTVTGAFDLEFTLNKLGITSTSGVNTFNVEDGIGVRMGTGSGNADLFFNELTNEVYAYSSNKITWDANIDVTGSVNVTAGQFVFVDGNSQNMGIGRNVLASTLGLDIINGSRSIKILDSGELGIYTAGITANKIAYLDASKNLTSASFGVSDVELNLNKGIAGGYASLDGAGKIPSTQIPAIAITDTYVVASQAAMLALSTAETGDVAVRTDVNKSFILKGTTYSVLADWQELLTPTSTVLSVNGYIGAVSLVTSDVVTAGSVTNAMLAGSIAFSKLIGTDITAVGSITTGTWGTGAVIAGATMTLGSDAAYDIYYRGATGVLTRLANGATGKFLSSTSGAAPTWESPLSICPVYSGKQRFIPYNTITTSSSFAGAVYYTPYYTGNKHTVTTITIEVTTLAAASTVKLALYADNNGVPGALIESSGDISAATTGDKSYTFSSPRLLSNPVYWLAVQLSSSTIGVRVSASFPTLIYQGGNGTGGTYKETQAYGAFPVNATPVVVSATALAITLTPQ
jgi:hypothetical protein